MLTQLAGYYSSRSITRAELISIQFGAGEQGVFYDPSDLSTLFQDAAGATPVTADSQPVGRMLDVSGNAHHATQSTAASRPLYRTDGMLHWLEFDGVDDFFDTLAVDFTTTNAVHVAFAVRFNATGNQWVAHHPANNNFGVSINSFAIGIIAQSGYLSFYTRGAGDQQERRVVADTNDTVWAGMLKNEADLTASQNIIIRKQGIQAVTLGGNVTESSGNYQNAKIRIGFSSSAFPLGGRMYGYMTRGAFSNGTAQRLTDQYFAQKSGVTL